jgi:aryl-alcohol dehydrogenase-like predicted oxidoreductase
VSGVGGRATAEGTGRFRSRAVNASRATPDHFRATNDGLVLSSIGLGTYIGRPDAPTDHAVEEAVGICLTSGRVNVIDTAINYRFQRAERSIGRALRRALDAGSVAREEVFVATKNGYFAPDAESEIPTSQWVETELVRPGILDPTDVVEGCHSMSVPYLTDQFRRSRENLGLGTIDLLYLHNAPDAQLPSVGPEEFARRLAGAFELFERFRSEGHLGAYGLATWDSLRTKRSDPGYLGLEAAVRMAEKAGGEDHGFRYIQFPFNMGMPEAALFRNQIVHGERLSLLEAADRLRVNCFTSVPLLQGQLARAGPSIDGLSAAQTAIQFARSAPGTMGPLIGQKSPEHLSENLGLSVRAPWDPEKFE